MVSIDQILTLQLIWIVGAAERLYSYGFLSDVPLRLTPSTVDTFVEINEKSVLEKLFPEDSNIVDLFKVMAKSEWSAAIQEFPESAEMIGPAPTDQELEVIGRLIVDYKNNPSALTRIALERNL